MANARPSLRPGCLCPRGWSGIVLGGSSMVCGTSSRLRTSAAHGESVRKMADRASARPFLTSVWGRAGIQSASEPWAASLTLWIVMDLPALCRQQLPGLGQWPRPSPWANIRTLIVGKKTSVRDPLLTENVRSIYVHVQGQDRQVW